MVGSDEPAIESRARGAWEIRRYGVLCTFLLVACSGEDARAPYVGDCSDPQTCTTVAHGARDAGASDGARQCLDNLPDTTPSTGTIQGFKDNNFDPTDLVPIDGPARVTALADKFYGLACASWDGEQDFELVGAEIGTGPLRIDPEGGADFFPTVINAVILTSAKLPTIPVFTNDEVNSVFEQLGTKLDPDKAQILIEVACPGAVPGRNRQIGVGFSNPGEAVAYSVGGTFTEDADVTSVDGLALLVNVPAEDGLEGVVYVTPTEGTVDQFSAAASKGAMTYLAYCPGN